MSDPVYTVLASMVDNIMDSYIDHDARECPNMDKNEDTCYSTDAVVEKPCPSCSVLIFLSQARKALAS